MSREDEERILEFAHEIDTMAAEVYDRLAAARDDGPRELWRELASKEREHVEYWRTLLSLSKEGAIPQVFDDAAGVIPELEGIAGKVNSLLDQAGRDGRRGGREEVSRAFVVAYRLEFYLLSPSFSTLFRFLEDMPGDASPEDEYERHLETLYEGARAYAGSTPEVGLLGEMVRRLWRENRELARQSIVDPLTQVYNRRGLWRTLFQLAHFARRGGMRTGVLMVDVDGFKRTNDEAGHEAGDEVLRSVARAIRGSVRASDMVGRYGGEEFLVFVAPVAPGSVREVAEKIRARVEEETRAAVPATVSVGFAEGTLPEDPEAGVKKLMRKADNNLYRAKAAGRNSVAG